ncbi:MAG: hypothetical protein J5I90_22140 [Caldilineales bacterium]|nr:hypothetical protein [Caldilineales bacterium]
MEGLIDGVLPAEPATYQGVQREALRLQRLVQDLQVLSQAEAGFIPLELHPIAPAALAAAAVERLQLQFEDKGVTLREATDANLPPVLADAARPTQVLLNLLGNALHYTPAGGEVTVCVRQEGDEVTFLVEDSGIGISDEDLPHLFERFYRVDKSRARGRRLGHWPDHRPALGGGAGRAGLGRERGAGTWQRVWVHAACGAAVVLHQIVILARQERHTGRIG